METFSTLLAICAGNSPVRGEFLAQRPVTRSFDVALICVWINGWVNNREVGDLRRYRAHYDVIVMDHMNQNMTENNSLDTNKPIHPDSTYNMAKSNKTQQNHIDIWLEKLCTILTVKSLI